MPVQCSQCGVDLSLIPTDRFVRCSSCGSVLTLTRGRVCHSSVVLPILEGRQAAQTAADAFLSASLARGEATVRFVPYWVEPNRLVLAAPSLEALEGVPGIRTKPAGTLRFLDSDSQAQWGDEAFLETESLPGEGDRAEILFCPYFCIGAEGEEGGAVEIWVDALDGTVLDAPPVAIGRSTLQSRLSWFIALFALPVFAGLVSAPWPVIVGSGALVGVAGLALRRLR